MGNCLGRKSSSLNKSFILIPSKSQLTDIDNTKTSSKSIEFLDTSPTLSNSSFSTYSSQEYLVVSPSISSLSLDQFDFILNPNHFIKHSYQTLRSFIDESYHHIHQQRTTILIEHKIKQDSIEILIANVTYNLLQICFNEKNRNELFGFVSKRNSNTLEQILIDRSKPKLFTIHSTKFYFVLSVDKWPEDIEINYRNRSTRLWPLNIEHLFDKTCFIRYKTNENSTYTYTAIEHQLIHSMSNEQKSLASKLWNYLNAITECHLPYRIFKHMFFYFLEKYPLTNFSCLKSTFLDFFLSQLDKQQCPHYFDSNRNLYHDQLKILCSTIRTINSESRLASISPNYFSKLTYLIEFLRHFQLSRTILTENILHTHESISQQNNFNYHLDLEQLDRYQDQNIEIIRNYLPLIRQYESSLIIHTYWSLFIQYFNSLFHDVFISKT